MTSYLTLTLCYEAYSPSNCVLEFRDRLDPILARTAGRVAIESDGVGACIKTLEFPSKHLSEAMLTSPGWAEFCTDASAEGAELIAQEWRPISATA